jgi:hypothetical protein
MSLVHPGDKALPDPRHQFKTPVNADERRSATRKGVNNNKPTSVSFARPNLTSKKNLSRLLLS